MTTEELLGRRWAAHGLGGSSALPVEAAVRNLGAVQAQDYSMALLAVTLRSTGSGTGDVEAALDRGLLVRTHILRPTWHLVAAADLRWMLALTAPHVARMAGSGYRRDGVTPEIRSLARRTLEALLQPGPATRGEIGHRFGEVGLPAEGLGLVHCLMDAELEGLVCNGPRRGKEPSYDLVDRRVSPAGPLPRDEALARLASRFFGGHGPATDRDFAWWSGLGLTEARQGIEAALPRLIPVPRGDLTLWQVPGAELRRPGGFAWLPAFDEFVIAYEDRTAVIPVQHQPKAVTKNGIFNPLVLVDGVAAGVWRRSPKARSVEVTVEWFDGAPPGGDEASVAWAGVLQRLRPPG